MEVIFIVLGVVALILIIILIIYLITKTKGKISINLSKYNYSPGETVSGTITLSLKKPVTAKSLNVGIIGIAKNTNYNYSNGGSRSTRSNTIYDVRKSIDSEKIYPAGEKIYEFKVLIPQNILSQSAFGEKAIGTLVKSAQILTGNITNVKWYVIGNLEMPGFDISKKVQINIR